MPRIHTLPDHLVNQIAAGEVVERPAAALKEIVENSVDAGATEIAVELAGGGIRLIRVADNGAGIHPDDLPLALSRHATSKISSLSDLQHIQSMGFRGEGLASIASVSRLLLTSRQADKECAAQIRAEDGKLSPLSAAARPTGTTVEAAELFFNTPARRKFLKSEATEYAHCAAALERIALAHPHIAFSLKHNGKDIFRYPAQTQEERTAAILGEAFQAACLPVNGESSGMRLSGYIAKPTFTQSKSGKQYCFVNRRFVRDKIMQHAVKQAYRDVLHHQISPAFVLFLEIAPDLADANAHPAKTEIRFRDSQAVHQLVFHTLDKALSETRADTTSSISNPTAALDSIFGTIRQPESPPPAPVSGILKNQSAPAPYARAPQQRSLTLRESRAALAAYAELCRTDETTPPRQPEQPIPAYPRPVPRQPRRNRHPRRPRRRIGKLRHPPVRPRRTDSRACRPRHAWQKRPRRPRPRRAARTLPNRHQPNHRTTRKPHSRHPLLPRLGARRPPTHPARNERPSARHGKHPPQQPMQPRPPHLGKTQPHRLGQPIYARTIKRRTKHLSDKCFRNHFKQLKKIAASFPTE